MKLQFESHHQSQQSLRIHSISGQSLLFGVMAMTTYRMKCFWSPYICIMASVMVCDTEMWGFIADKLTNAGQVKGKSTIVGSVTDASHLSVVRSG